MGLANGKPRNKNKNNGYIFVFINHKYSKIDKIEISQKKEKSHLK
jgi:hypothetical protein